MHRIASKARARLLVEGGVGGKRALDVEALGAQRGDRRRDDRLLLVAHGAVLAGMRD